MAFTVSVTRGVAGNKRLFSGRITFGAGTYPTGGTDCSATSLGMTVIDYINFGDPDGTDDRARYDKTNQKLLLFRTNGAQFTSGSDLTTWGDVVDFVAFGR
jgi:hypothetical protein